MKVIIAEKPSYAMTIRKALETEGEHFSNSDGYFKSENYIVTFQFGYLMELYTIEDYEEAESKGWKEDILPYVPADYKFKYKLKDDKGIAKQYGIIKKLVLDKSVTEIIEAGDSDSAGCNLVNVSIDSIFRESGIDKPRKRLWSSDQTTKTILESLHNLKDASEYDNYTNEEHTRACIDFLLGINLTRKFSLMNYRLTANKNVFSIGRCNTSIVNMIYDRDMEIRSFRPEDYYQVESAEKTNGEVIKLVYKEKYKDIEAAKGKAQELNKCDAVVIDVEDNLLKKEAPKLFSLSTIQGTLSDRFKMSMDQSLKTIQSLYEAGYVTYPRTNTEYLSTEEIPKVEKIIKMLNGQGLNLIMKKTKSVFNNERVESHSALIPTTKAPDINSLNKDQKIVYETIKNRFIAKFLNEETIISQTIITIAVGEEEFKIKGEVVKNKGFYAFEPLPKSKTENTLPNLKKGDEVVISFGPVKKQTTPPAKITIKKLNSMMENPFAKEYKNEDEEYKDLLLGCSIGTPATRSILVNNIQRVGYVVEKNGVLSITEKGIYLIETLKALNVDIDKYKTVEFQKILKQVFRSEMTPEEAITVIANEIRDMFNNIKNVADIKGYKDSNQEEVEPLGICPRCKKYNIVESGKAFYCEGYRNEENKCTFAIWKNDKFFEYKGKKVTRLVAKKLVNEGKALVKGMKNKEGNKYDAYVLLDDTGKYVNFKLDFTNESKSTGTGTASNSIGKCPRCGKVVMEGEKNFYCTGYKDTPKCTFAMWKNDKFFSEKGKGLGKIAAKKFLEDGKAHIKNLKKSDGTYYNADIVMTDTGKYINFKFDSK